MEKLPTISGVCHMPTCLNELVFTYIADQYRRRWVSMAHYLLSCSMTREQLLTE